MTDGSLLISIPMAMTFRQFNDGRITVGQHSQVSCQGQGWDCWHGCQGELDHDDNGDIEDNDDEDDGDDDDDLI